MTEIKPLIVKDLINKEVIRYSDAKIGTIIAATGPPPNSLDGGICLLIAWTDGSRNWEDAGDVEIPELDTEKRDEANQKEEKTS